jgi:hypothetical protein
LQSLEDRANNDIAFKLLSGSLNIPQDRDEEKPSEESDPSKSEPEPEEDVVEASTDEIWHSISSLFRLTVVIQNLSSRDRLERMEKIDMSHFKNSDIGHVRDKFQLKKEGDYLSERLGKANTKRR